MEDVEEENGLIKNMVNAEMNGISEALECFGDPELTTKEGERNE